MKNTAVRAATSAAKKGWKEGEPWEDVGTAVNEARGFHFIDAGPETGLVRDIHLPNPTETIYDHETAAHGEHCTSRITLSRLLAQSAHDGCVRCMLLLRGYRTALVGDWNGFTSSPEWLNNYGVFELFKRRPRPGDVGVRQQAAYFEIFTDYTKPHVPSFAPRGIPSGDTGSPAALEFIQKQLRACVQNHPRCGGKQIKPLPTRVLVIEDIDHIRLWETGGVSEQYAALSPDLATISLKKSD
ncbi:hypothetical protein CC80DRAFT_595090 [Byssothecium circinans]|uniref:Uncharacterized protein n=1 Tax=Byssothecium circinans TaxID=147558 RepID=A0A6A5TUA5_9PLEO|nr:hypothetical protein CC80DRAFT_595090 [Byssothecium circinans]